MYWVFLLRVRSSHRGLCLTQLLLQDLFLECLFLRCGLCGRLESGLWLCRLCGWGRLWLRSLPLHGLCLECLGEGLLGLEGLEGGVCLGEGLFGLALDGVGFGEEAGGVADAEFFEEFFGGLVPVVATDDAFLGEDGE